MWLIHVTFVHSSIVWLFHTWHMHCSVNTPVGCVQVLLYSSNQRGPMAGVEFHKMVPHGFPKALPQVRVGSRGWLFWVSDRLSRDGLVPGRGCKRIQNQSPPSSQLDSTTQLVWTARCVCVVGFWPKRWGWKGVHGGDLLRMRMHRPFHSQRHGHGIQTAAREIPTANNPWLERMVPREAGVGDDRAAVWKDPGSLTHHLERPPARD